jgi:hypothetical protein
MGNTLRPESQLWLRPPTSSCGISSWLLENEIGPIVPDLVGEVATEEASHLLRAGFSTVEEPTRGEVVELFALLEHLVRGYGFLWMVLSWTLAICRRKR